MVMGLCSDCSTRLCGHDGVVAAQATKEVCRSGFEPTRRARVADRDVRPATRMAPTLG